MTDDTPHPDGLFASLLDHLFRTVHPHDRGPYTPAEVAAAINAAAGDNVISATYMWQLKTGRRDNPTYKHVMALSRFFGVSPTYFFDEAETERGAIPPEVALALKDDAVRDLVLRAAGLSEHSLKAIAGMVDSARELEEPARPRRPRRAAQ